MFIIIHLMEQKNVFLHTNSKFDIFLIVIDKQIVTIRLNENFGLKQTFFHSFLPYYLYTLSTHHSNKHFLVFLHFCFLVSSFDVFFFLVKSEDFVGEFSKILFKYICSF